MQIGYGDMARTLLMSRQTTAAKTAMTRLSQELTTGLASDSARQLSGNLGQVNTIDAAMARLAAFTTVTTEMGTRAGAMQTALGVVADLAQSGISALLPLDATTTSSRVDAAATTARAALETVISTLNTRLGDRALFSGTAGDTAPLAGADDLLAALQPLTAGAASAADAEAAVAAWFDDPSGFPATFYAGGPAAGPLPVAEGDTVRLDLTADDPALRGVMKGLAMAALVDSGLFAGQPEARRDLATRAGSVLVNAQDGLTETSARLGLAEAHIADAATRNAAESAAYELARTNLLGIDSYDTATRLTDTEERLQLLYELTGRLSKLTLVDYI
jgi:flagellar hook-associated protein 3 FlgL